MHDSKPRRSILVFALVALGVTPRPAETQDALRVFERTECDYPLPAGIPTDITRECGYIVVPENRARPDGRSFRLAVVIYRAQAPDESPPLLLLHGGPGGIGGTRFPWREMQLPHMRRRDVVTFDNRGVGGSEPRFCPDWEEQAAPAFYQPTRQQWEQVYRAAVRACVAELVSLGLDPTAYGADVNAADAMALRHALGYATWDIYGVSYGAEVAQELLRLDDQAVRAAAFVSGLPPGLQHVADRTLSFQRTLERIFASCGAQPACHSAFPTPDADFDALYEELSAQPFEVQDPQSPSGTVLLNDERFLMEIQQESREPSTIARLPLLLHELRRGDRQAALRRLIGGDGISPWEAVGRLVQCNEYGAGYRAAVAATLPLMTAPFRTIADDFREHCDLWVPNLTRQVDSSMVVSDVPTLVLHGEYDWTDVEAAQRSMTAGLRRAYVYTFPGEGHGGPPVGCHGSIVEQFLENPTRAPDASCLARMPRIRFRTADFAPTVTFVFGGESDAPSRFTGIWEATLLAGPDITIEIEIDGDSVSGMVAPQIVPVDGNVNGTNLMVQMRSPDRTRTITLTGTLNGDVIEFTRDVSVVPNGNPGGGGLLGGVGLRSITARRVP